MRTFAEWQVAAKASRSDLLALGEELREMWHEGNDLIPYETLEEALQTELGISVKQLVDRRHREKKKRDLECREDDTQDQDDDPDDVVAGAENITKTAAEEDLDRDLETGTCPVRPWRDAKRAISDILVHYDSEARTPEQMTEMVSLLNKHRVRFERKLTKIRREAKAA